MGLSGTLLTRANRSGAFRFSGCVTAGCLSHSISPHCAQGSAAGGSNRRQRRLRSHHTPAIQVKPRPHASAVSGRVSIMASGRLCIVVLPVILSPQQRAAMSFLFRIRCFRPAAWLEGWSQDAKIITGRPWGRRNDIGPVERKTDFTPAIGGSCSMPCTAIDPRRASYGS
jgi:hypothetical protein